ESAGRTAVRPDARALPRHGGGGSGRRPPQCQQRHRGRTRTSRGKEAIMKHKGKNIHFVGIGGSGISGIAEVLHNLGYTVSGSDLGDNAVTQRLASLGIRVVTGHAGENIGEADAVVTSSAVKADNPEVLAARARKVPIVPRAVMLGELM